MNLLMELNTALSKMLREKINIVIVLLIAILSYSIYSDVSTKSIIKQSTIEIKKKIDYRYFNLTKSLEEINNVEVDTYNGELKYKPKN